MTYDESIHTEKEEYNNTIQIPDHIILKMPKIE